VREEYGAWRPGPGGGDQGVTGKGRKVTARARMVATPDLHTTRRTPPHSEALPSGLLKRLRHGTERPCTGPVHREARSTNCGLSARPADSGSVYESRRASPILGASEAPQATRCAFAQRRTRVAYTGTAHEL